MLKKSNRLNRAEFDRVFKDNQTVHGDRLIFLKTNESDLKDKFAVVVSKKTFKRRVDRNRLRRLIYHSIQKLLPDNLGYGGIVIVKKSATDLLDLSQSDIFDQIKSLLRNN